MTSERVQRQIDRLLDEAERAAGERTWAVVKDRTEHALTFDPGNADALALLAAAERGLGQAGGTMSLPAPPATPTAAPQPASFANGRYVVRRFLGEGGKKKVYLAHDTLLDRDVAFALIKTEGLDEAARERVSREAQAMGRLGSHPHIVTVFDIGEEAEQPYLVLPLLPGGDVEGLIEKAEGHRLPIEQAVKLAIDTCQGLEFAHSKGIVHRDLKPGNVWLAEDGRAMIGDFGLAVAMDRSRLTQAGMMVGTVNYMPPEQAMGGEITPRSDLYSLGAMLYEMVCGRPPFVGDESVAIIGQHLNTPPVAPAWHRPDCPAALEALILRLLEKDPSKRPANAAEVREALTLALSQRERRPEGEASPPAPSPYTERGIEGDPLYRRTFVGREQELRQLRAAFDAALSGHGSIAMVVGEPGIGKTSVCEQLATYVTLRGGKALVGHCYEEGSLSLPYLPFVEALRSYVLQREPDGLRKDLGAGASEVARIVSEVRDKVQVSPSDGGDPDEKRWRLLQAVMAFLRNASLVQPIVLVLEDLHDADRGTLDMLLHLSRNLEGARLLIVGTYRDVEVDRSHPLSAAVAELRRAGSFLRVPLRGLTVDEVHRMYEATRGNSVPWQQAELVHRQTEGNPLFVQEVLRYFVEEGLVVREEGRFVPREGVAAAVPEGLRDVVGRRLNRLSEGCNQVLSVASVMGREFRLDALQLITNVPEDDLYASLQEATERAIVEERSSLGATVTYRFTHAFFRQTLYEEIIAPRRIRLHRQVASALESVYGRRLEDHAAELAEHYSHSSDPEDLKKAVDYGALAARRASSVFDYGKAEHHLRQALQVQDVLDSEDFERKCDLMLALGEAMFALYERRKVLTDVAPTILDLAQRLSDDRRAFAACRLALDCLVGPVTDLTRNWQELAERYVGSDLRGRVRLNRAKAGSLVQRGYAAAAADSLRETLLLARNVGDVNEEVGVTWLLLFTGEVSPDESLTLLNEAIERSGNFQGVSLFNRTGFARMGFEVHLSSGDREAAERYSAELSVLARTTGHQVAVLQASHVSAFLKMLDGELEPALRDFNSWNPEVAEYYRGRILDWLGRSQAKPLAQRSAAGSPSFLPRALEITTLHRAGQSSEARQAFRGLYEEMAVSKELVGFRRLAALLDLAILLDEESAVEDLFEWFGPGPKGRILFADSPSSLSVDAILGGAARRLGRLNEARSCYEQALEDYALVRHRPEAALTRLELAELLLEHFPDECDVAIEHLDFAINEFREMKMQPSLERALRHRGLLKA
jgi:hypothetical protein